MKHEPKTIRVLFAPPNATAREAIGAWLPRNGSRLFQRGASAERAQRQARGMNALNLSN